MAKLIFIKTKADELIFNEENLITAYPKRAVDWHIELKFNIAIDNCDGKTHYIDCQNKEDAYKSLRNACYFPIEKKPVTTKKGKANATTKKEKTKS